MPLDRLLEVSIHGHGKAIALPWLLEDVAKTVRPVPKSPSQRRDVYPQVDFFHHAIRPDPRDKRVLAANVSGVLPQHPKTDPRRTNPCPRPPAPGTYDATQQRVSQ